MRPSSRGFVLAAPIQPFDATTTLFFTHSARVAPGVLRIVAYGRRGMGAHLGAASALVIIRGLFECADVLRCARRLGIPRYYFADDNFIVLRDLGGPAARFVTRYSEENVRAELQDFEGVLLATPALVDDYSRRRLHSRLHLFPPVAEQVRHQSPAAPRQSLHVAFYGGRHLHPTLLSVVMPALRRLARERPVTLIAVGVTEALEESAGLTVMRRPYDESYARGVSMLAGIGVDVLIHPVAPGLANNAFKNPHAVITANALGAVPVVSNAAPYTELASHDVLLLCDDSEDSWYQALGEAAGDDGLRARLAAYCGEHFAGAANREFLARLLELHPAPARWRTPFRAGLAGAQLIKSRAGRVASRLSAQRARATTA